MEWVPVSDSWYFKEFQEGEAYSNSEPEDHLEQLHLCAVHVGIDIVQEEDIEECDISGKVLDRASRSHKEEDEEL